MLIDTNVYIALARGEPQIVEIVEDSVNLSVPLPVIAEMRFGFAKGSKSKYNEENLQKFLAQPQISILFPTIKTTEYYANLQLFCVKRGKALSQNDIWIASLAREHGESLVTFDQDFQVFKDTFEDKLIIL